MDHPDAFQALVVATHVQVRTYLACRGVPSADVDDLAQEVYLRHHAQPGQRPAEVPEIAWLKGIARHVAADHFRRKVGPMPQRRLVSLAELGDLIDGAAAEEPADNGQALAALRCCLELMGEAQQRMLAWHYGESLDAEVIGSRLARPAASVRKALLRLREVLRDCMARQDVRGLE